MRKGNGVYKAYVFKDQDPAIDQLRSMGEKHFGKSIDVSQINRDGGPSVSCMRSWFNGQTKRPRNDTIEAAGRAMGWERTWKRMRSNQP
jgi:hypothetical protein